MLVKGTAYEDLFHYSDNPIMKKIWNERMKPYHGQYPTVGGETGCVKVRTTTVKSITGKILS